VLVRIVLWSLAESETTVDELRDGLRETTDTLAAVPGLRFKAWISDEATERFGAIELWDSAEAAAYPAPQPERELIGSDPDLGEEFELEASVGSLP
jgi:hypothetical protein